MKIALYGGSFNPVHYGHIGLSRWVLDHTDCDAVWLMVSPNNPLKDPHVLADENDRLRGVREAIEASVRTMPLAVGKRLMASDFEFTLPRPTYTAHTLRMLREAYPHDQFVLLIGEDNWRCFDRWREHEWIRSQYEILVYPRHGSNEETNMSGEVSTGKVHYLVGAPYFDISSTQIREGSQSPYNPFTQAPKSTC